jgi:hypothetical protein
MTRALTSEWSYGAEHELADWDIRGPLPFGCSHNNKDYTIVNSNGIANDPKGKAWPFGGEINTRPTRTMAEQGEILEQIVALHPSARVNYRSNLHLHIRVPGLKDDLEFLKQVQRYIHRFGPVAVKHCEPIPKPTAAEYPIPEELTGALRRYKRRKVSHQTFLTPQRVARQQEAKSIQEFFELECPVDKNGRVMWHAQPRCAINLRQLRETDTVEFRHFPGTLKPKELVTALMFCHDFLLQAMLDWPDEGNLRTAKHFAQEFFPKFEPYDHAMEEGYRRTCHDGTNGKDDILAAIMQLEGMF